MWQWSDNRAILLQQKYRWFELSADDQQRCDTSTPTALSEAGGAFRNLWWVQDGAPAHRLVAVRERLRELFGQRVIALYHNVEWSPRSPDLTPCDFFLWGYLKSKVYTSPPVDLADLQYRISNEVDALRNSPATIRRVVQAMLQRCQLCIVRDGGHVEGRGSIIFCIFNVNMFE